MKLITTKNLSKKNSGLDIRATVFVISFILCTGINAFCQPYDPKFHTPDAASFMKFIDNQVSLFTGSVDISIPVTTINDGSISIPIVLRYNTNGIKVMEEASWVGLGWNLSVGGVITHSINGERDISYPYYTLLNSEYIARIDNGYTSPLSGQNLSIVGNVYYDPSAHVLDAISAINNSYSGQLTPDIYYFSFLDYSGKFYVHPLTNEVRLINNDSRIKISRHNGSGVPFWKVVTPEGMTLFFTYYAASNHPATSNISSENFYLSQIIFPDGEIVKFDYNSDASSSFVFNNDYKRIGHINIENGPALYSHSYTTYTLKSITTPNVKVNFNTVKDRLDLPNERRLESIDIVDNYSGDRRSFKFIYEYFTSSASGNYCSSHPLFVLAKATKRLKLVEFREEGHASYMFNYIGGLPIKTSYAVDYWGFYNGKTENTRLYPNYSHLYPADDAFPIKSGANRATNPDYATAGLLNSIVYPTGGIRRIEYASNTFTNQLYVLSTKQLDSLDVTGGSNQYISDLNESSEQTYYQFYVNKPTKIKIIGHISRGSGTYNDVKDAYIELRYYSNLIKRWDMVGLYDHASYSVEYEATLQPIGTYPYSVTVSIPNSLGPQGYAGSLHISATATIYLNDTELSDFSCSTGGGVRVARELLFDAGSTKPNLIYKYEYSTGHVMTPLKFDMTYYSAHYPQENPNNCDSFTDYEMSSINYYPENTFGIGLVGYSYVDVHTEGQVNWESGIDTYDNGKTSFEFYEQVDENSHLQNYVYGAPLYGQPLNGLLKRKTVYNSDNTVKKEEQNYYTQTGKAFFWGLHAVNYDRGCNMGGGTYGQAVTYPVRSYMVKLDKKIEVLDGVTTTTNYKYNAIGQVARDSIYTSTGDLITSIYKYPYDLASSDPILMAMKNENILDKLVTVEIRYPNNGIYKEKYKYDLTRSVPNPFNSDIAKIYSVTQRDIFRNDLIDPFYRDFYTYNPKLVETRREHNISTSYIWGYKQAYPVVKIDGISYNNISSAIKTNISGRAFTSSSSYADVKADVDYLKAQLSGLISDLRYVTTIYTYSPLVGMTSQTDPNGVTTYYEYDSFGRLKTVKDNDGHILKSYDYHYKGGE